MAIWYVKDVGAYEYIPLNSLFSSGGSVIAGKPVITSAAI